MSLKKQIIKVPNYFLGYCNKIKYIYVYVIEINSIARRDFSLLINHSEPKTLVLIFSTRLYNPQHVNVCEYNNNNAFFCILNINILLILHKFTSCYDKFLETK